MPHFDRFDICMAFYVFAMLYHGGKRSNEYAVFGRLAKIRFDPGCSIGCSSEGYGSSGLHREEWANARSILAGMIVKHRHGQSPIRGR